MAQKEPFNTTSKRQSILFVCTGNTCRSPLAEVLCKRMLAERLGCAETELSVRGFEIGSAGLAAVGGLPAAEEAQVIARELGVDLSQHHSRMISPEMIRDAAEGGEIVTMTTNHQRTLMQVVGEGTVLIRTLGDGEDIPDPIGGDRDVYRQCAETIQAHLQRFVQEWQSE